MHLVPDNDPPQRFCDEAAAVVSRPVEHREAAKPSAAAKSARTAEPKPTAKTPRTAKPGTAAKPSKQAETVAAPYPDRSVVPREVAKPAVAKPAVAKRGSKVAKSASRAEAGAAAKPVRRAQPVVAPKPGGSAAPGTVSKPLTPAEPQTTAKSVRQAKAARRVKGGTAAKTLSPTEPGPIAKPVRPREPGVSKPARSAEPGVAVEPSTPAGPGVAAKPTSSSCTERRSKTRLNAEEVLKLYKEQAKKVVTDDLTTWSMERMAKYQSILDIPKVVSILKNLDSPADVHDYVKRFFGSSQDNEDFANEFLEKRDECHKESPEKKSEKPVFVSTPREASYGDMGDKVAGQAVSRRAKKERTRMRVMHNPMLGFVVQADSSPLNAGDIIGGDGQRRWAPVLHVRTENK